MLVGLADHLIRLSEILLLFILQLLSLLMANVLVNTLCGAIGDASSVFIGIYFIVFSALKTFVEEEFFIVIYL